MPQLIDTVEKDDRLTRSVHFWRDFARSRTVLGVREAALTAVMSILRVRVFEPVATGDNFTSRGEKGQEDVVAQLRAYWKRYGAMPYADRMLAVIVDPMAKPEAMREAAYNLASIGEKRVIATTVFTGGADGQRDKPNPAIMKFQNPTAAEAILHAMDRELAQHDGAKRDSLYEYERRQIENAYIFPIADLGDPRILGELERRISPEPRARMKFKYAYVCYTMHFSAPLKQLAAQLAAGQISLPANNQPNTNDDDQPGNTDLRTILGLLLASGLDKASQAIYAAADPTHPLYPLLRDRVMHARESWGEESVWFRHPYCLEILGLELTNTRKTGGHLSIEGDRLVERTNKSQGSSDIPRYLHDANQRRASADTRVQDEAAERLSWMMIAAPRYHALLKDADVRRAEIGQLLARFYRRWRLPTNFEVAALDISLSDPWFLPDIKPLGRPAKKEDVDTGRAIFHLDGGKLSPAKLPARIVLKKPWWEKIETHYTGQDDGDPTRGIVVQAEIAADGQTYYGVIMRRGLFKISAEELKSIKPLNSHDDK